MAVKRMNKKDIVRSQITDEVVLALNTDNSLLGIYNNKVRFEILDDEGNPLQFSVAITLHKDLVEEADCGAYQSTEDKLALIASAPKAERKTKAKTENAFETIDVEKEKNTNAKVDLDLNSDEAMAALAALGVLG